MNIDEEEWVFAMVMSENFEKKLRQENAKLKERIEELENANMKMRSFDKEEQKNYTEAINKVYKPTGVKLFNKESE